MQLNITTLITNAVTGLPQTKPRAREVRLLQAGRSFYFINEAVPKAEGERSFADGKLQIKYGELTTAYPAVKLSADDLFSFTNRSFQESISWSLYTPCSL